MYDGYKYTKYRRREMGRRTHTTYILWVYIYATRDTQTYISNTNTRNYKSAELPKWCTYTMSNVPKQMMISTRIFNMQERSFAQSTKRSRRRKPNNKLFFFPPNMSIILRFPPWPIDTDNSNNIQIFRYIQIRHMRDIYTYVRLSVDNIHRLTTVWLNRFPSTSIQIPFQLIAEKPCRQHFLLLWVCVLVCMSASDDLWWI